MGRSSWKRSNYRRSRLHLRRVAFPADAIDEIGGPLEIAVALQCLAEALGDADGGLILRMNEADDAVPLQNDEGMSQGGQGGLRRIAAAPPPPHERPGQLEACPALRIGEAGHPDERA